MSVKKNEAEIMNDSIDNKKLTNSNKQKKKPKSLGGLIIKPITSLPFTKLKDEEEIITFVDGGKVGKRVTLSKKIYSKLGLSDTIQIGFDQDGILLGEKIPGQTYSYKLEEQGVKYSINSSDLVKECTEKLNLNFRIKNRSSITFHHIEYDNTSGILIAIVSI